MTKTIKNPLPLDVVWQVLLHELMIYPPLFFDYIHAPSMIINKINNTRTIADDEPQFSINTYLLFCLFTLFYGNNSKV